MADAKTPIVRQMSVAPTTSAPPQSTGNSGPSGSGGSEHTKTPQVRPFFPGNQLVKTIFMFTLFLQHFNVDLLKRSLRSKMWVYIQQYFAMASYLFIRSLAL